MAANGSLWVRLAAISGLISVAAGAFAAHSVKDPGARELLRTGASYEATHALATLAAVALGGRGSGLIPALFLGGTVLFSGSLYALALGASHAVGAITPIGGLAFIAGWAVFALQAGGARGRRA
ncbi:MAG TPA: DUF423 domain-containing protein [Caulobacteraceae bacterium]|jgi:uncharacterized membrane protein YgdD (TMEM256/DUF423 family)